MQSAKMTNEQEANLWIKTLESIRKQKDQLKDDLASFIQDEKYLGYQPTDFTEFEVQCEQFQIFEDLWLIVAAW